MVAVVYERCSLTRGSKYSDFDLKIFGILDNWSARRGGCLRQLFATQGSTVDKTRFSLKLLEYILVIQKVDLLI